MNEPVKCPYCERPFISYGRMAMTHPECEDAAQKALDEQWEAAQATQRAAQPTWAHAETKPVT